MKKPPHRIRDAVAFLRFARMQYGGFFWQLWWILLPAPPQLRPGRQLTRRVPGEER